MPFQASTGKPQPMGARMPTLSPSDRLWMALVTSPAFITENWMNSFSDGLVVMAKVDSPTPNTPNWPTWPGMKEKLSITAGSSNACGRS